MLNVKYFLFIPSNEKETDYELKTFNTQNELDDFLIQKEEYDFMGNGILISNAELQKPNSTFSEFAKEYKERKNIPFNKALHLLVDENKKCKRINNLSLTNNQLKEIEQNNLKLLNFVHWYTPEFYLKRDVLKSWGNKEKLF